MNKIRRVTIIVIGHVQGVFFREGVKRIADELKITGWVRNESMGRSQLLGFDGKFSRASSRSVKNFPGFRRKGETVKILAEGTEENLQKLIDWVKVGTKWSKVESVKVEWKDAIGKFNGFEIQ